MGEPCVLTVVGARPQFVKAAVLCRAFAAGGGFRHVLVHTGQHGDPEMSGVFFDELGIPAPDHHLGVSGGSHGEMAGRMLVALDPVLARERPDAVVVVGDTNSTLAGALAAAQHAIPVAHVEAGLRSFDRRMVEEVNRVVADHLSALLLCPTSTSVRNLGAEGITSGVHHVGDVMYDAALFAGRRAAAEPPERRDPDRPGPNPEPPFVVVTIHRAENTGDPVRLQRLFDYVRAESGGRAAVFPIHPRTAAAAERFGISLDGFAFGPPVGYFAMARLLQRADAVFTDSGGLQKEAYFHRVPCVTLRDVTEWTETVAAGWNRLWVQPAYATPRRDIDEYGTGDTGRRITEILRSFVARA